MIAGLIVAYGAKNGSTTETVAELLSGLINGSTYKLSTSAKSLVKSFMGYLQKDLLPLFDALPADIDMLSARDKETILDTVASSGPAGQWLAHMLETSTQRQVQSGLAALVRKISPDLGSVVVKTPVAVDANFKKEIRKSFKDDFVVFTTDTSLLGGILVYKNGQLIDNSWLGKINSVKELVTK